jgi:Trk K+ transport system NAD-binding subunit
MYIIFGCGSTGNAVTEILTKMEKEVLVVDRDESVLSKWRDLHVNVMASEISSFDINNPLCVQANIIMILTGDSKGNLILLKKLRTNLPASLCLLRLLIKKKQIR